MVKDPDNFTFNADAIRVPSARQLVYGDKRANPRGRLPDDTWILRPQDLPEGFQPDDDTWYFPRVAGTFKERSGFHGCQMPEQLLGRIIRISSNEEELVLDPFAGSGTTLAVACKLRRKYLGYEISTDYVKAIRQRLGNIQPGDDLDGAAELVERLAVSRARTQGRATLRGSCTGARSRYPASAGSSFFLRNFVLRLIPSQAPDLR